MKMEIEESRKRLNRLKNVLFKMYSESDNDEEAEMYFDLYCEAMESLILVDMMKEEEHEKQQRSNP